MWMFYLISLLLTLGMVTVTLLYFAGPEVPRYVLFTVGYAWFCSISIIVLVPADIWTATTGYDKGGIAFFWGWSYWSTFVLTWAVVPTIQGFEDAGDFTVTERLRTSVRNNLVFYLIIGGFGLFGLILLTIMHKNWGGTNVVGYAMACSNTFGLVTGAFLLGFGLSEIPKSLWKNADWGNRQKVLSHRIAKMAVNLDEAHQDLSNAIVIAQATSNQMSKRDPLRPCMDIIDAILVKMFKADPSFKPTGGRLGENDMDYDADEKSMATLRRQLGRARDQYYRYRSEYMTYVMEALELEDTIKNYERGAASGWKYISSFRPARTGNFGQSLDMLEWVWRCILKKQLEKFLAVLLGCMSVAILLAEATILPSGVDLSLFSILIKAVGKKEVLVQTMAFVPLMYMCICTYYSLFKIGMLMVYSLTPRQTGSVSLLMICAMVARYAPPVSYNFLNLIRLDGGVKTTFEKRMGNIDDAVPFFGHGFNKIYPLIMVIYTLLVASNFFGRIIEFFGSWKKLSGFQNEAEDFDGFDPSGVIILQKERSWLEKGSNVGEHVIPLARNFNDATSDLEAADAHVKPVRNENGSAQQTRLEMKSVTSVSKDDASRSRSNKDDGRRQSSREVIGNKYALLKQQETASHSLPDSAKPSSTVSLLQADKSKREPDKPEKLGSTSGLANRWASMKTNFQSWKTNMEVRKFLPLGQTQDVKGESSSSLESLDEIFAKLKRRPDKRRDDDYGSEDDDIRTSSCSLKEGRVRSSADLISPLLAWRREH